MALGVDATYALVMSQVVLSIALPAPMIALVVFTRQKKLMGEFANSPLVDALAITGTVVVVSLNMVLLALTFGVGLPGLG